MSKFGGIFLNKLSQQVNTNVKKPNSLNMIHPIHSLLVRKLNQKEKSSNIITREINDCLNLPEKFFSSNSKITVGKKIKLTNMKIIGMEKALPKKMNFQSKRMTLRRSYSLSNINNLMDHNLRNSISTTFMSYKDKFQQQVNNDKYDLVDNEQLKKIFNQYKVCKKEYIDNKKRNIKQNEKNNNVKQDQSKMSRNEQIPLERAESFSFQNNKLKIRKNMDDKIKNISKNICKLLNKKEKDLLLNKVDDYTFKKELLKEVDFNKPIEEKYGNFKWNISLRRPNNFEGMRNTYINLTRDQNPFWGIVVEKSPQIKEYKLKPGCLKKNKTFYEKFKKTYFHLINNKDYKNLENLDELFIKGNNLFNIEYNREINNFKGKKLLHKTFVDKNGKVILKTDINNIFGEKIFHENYNNLFLSIKNNMNKLSFRKKKFSKSSINFKEKPIITFMKNDEFKKKTFYKNSSLPML
jgi:hypothetical protein